MKNEKNIKIIFVDIDWTILDHNIHDWDYESIEVLKEAQNAGILVYINTARPYDSVVHTGLFNIFTPDGVICTNGGVTFIGDELLFSNIIPEEMVREVERISNKHHLVLELATNKERYFTAQPNEYVHRYFSVYAETIPIIKKYHNKEVSAILLFAPDKFDEKIKKEFPNEMNYLRFDDYGVDVGYFINQKGDAINKVLNHLNIDKKCAVSAGDSPDDITMFDATEHSIALGNGPEVVKEAATIVADTIGNHGLAKELIRLLK